ncbi:MAG: hypothetical protein H7Y20_10680 [Bryobacteraceae bacterium]|nr:hypothetical protein [Bryobacteraceae bacterium]
MNIAQRSIVTVIGLLFVAAPLWAQTFGSATEAQSRTRTIVASFSKFKSVSKERRGVKKEKYLKVQSEAAIKMNPAEYSGVYEVPGMAFALNLNVDRNGVVTGTGYEPLAESVRRTFTLRDGRIQGALVTATKVYAGGGSEKLDGAFMNRTSFDSPTAAGVTVFGFGTLGDPVEVSGVTINRFFYEKSR